MRVAPQAGSRPLHVAMVGTRGVPAHYGGFETAVEEIGRRLVERGHQVTVYCRAASGDEGAAARPTSYLGMQLRYLPSVKTRSLETLSHSGLATLDILRRARPDVVLLFNAANSVLVPLLRRRRTPVATHVDGLEWQREKWGWLGRHYYRVAESLAVRWSDALIADAAGIADYHREEFGAEAYQIAYGAPVLLDAGYDRVREIGFERHKYHLVVARFERENHVDLAIRGFLRSGTSMPLVVVGTAPYAGSHVARIHALARRNDRVTLLGGVWDQDLLDELYANALTYVHGHSVGGTNPSLLRAMGAGVATLCFDKSFNRDVTGEHGRSFRTAADLARLLEAAESDPAGTVARGRMLQQRAATVYTWHAVADEYERLCRDLDAGVSQHGVLSGRRSAQSRWR